MSWSHEDYALAVKKGAALLDEKYPMWVSAINLDQLDMVEFDCCVLGQLGREFSTSYYDMLERLGIAEHEGGFNEFPDEEDDIWSLLDDLWKNEIEARR